MHTDTLRILVLGASYGMLPGIKLSLAGHHVTFVAYPDEVRKLSAAPMTVRIPLRRDAREVLLSVTAADQAAAGSPALRSPNDVDASAADFVVFAMQEPQFSAPEIAALLAQIGEARRPCLSIMNLPPPPYLKQIGIGTAAVLAGVYTNEQIWDRIDPDLLAVASPDPQAVRLEPGSPGNLTVTLASNFKASRFGASAAQQTLERVARDVSHLKVRHDGMDIRPPVALVAHRSPYVPLAKWPMVLTGNFRCLTDDGVKSISAAVHDDLAASQRIYEFVCEVVRGIGASGRDLVPFDDYARAAKALNRPSSVARALAGRATAVERLDKLVYNIAQLGGRVDNRVEQIVSDVDRRLRSNIDQLR